MTLIFEVTDEQLADANKWIEEHEKTCTLTGKYLGAIGGRYCYEFVNTSIGTITNLKCACGERTCLTEPGRDI